MTALTLRECGSLFSMEGRSRSLALCPGLPGALGHLLRPPGLRSAPRRSGMLPWSPRASRGLPLGGQPVLGGLGRGRALLPTLEPQPQADLAPTPLTHDMFFLKAVGKASSFKTLIKKLFSSGTFQGPSKEGRKVFILTHEGNGL